MVKSLLIVFLCLSSPAYADLFDFGSESGSLESKIPGHIEKLKSLAMNDGPGFEETFNSAVKAIENSVEEEKLFCAGEASNSAGKVLPSSQKQLCMRELKKNYLDAQTTIFDIKKKYLSFIHQKQVQRLSEIQKKLKADIEKNF
jgi:hypothetical protein